MKEKHINTQTQSALGGCSAPRTHSDTAMLNYASSAPAQCSTSVLGRARGGAGLTSKARHPLGSSGCAHTSWEHTGASLPARESLPAPSTAQPRAGTPQGPGSLSAWQALHRVRNSSTAQSPRSSVSQRSLMESEGHPVSRINFALWCQSRVVQFIMGFNPCYSRYK